MKEKWEIKKLGELCEILDSLRKPITQKDRVKGIYPYYGATGIQDYINDFIFDEELLLVGEDGAKWGQNENTSFIVNEKCWVNNHAHVLRIKKNNSIKYISYFLNYSDLDAFITGAVVRKLNQASLNNIPIPIPPLSIQEAIVKELDILHCLKELQAQQLAQYDHLAQSTFYNMFGDPIENEKGWEVRKLGEVCEINPRKSEINELNKNIIVSFVPMANVGEKGELFLNENKKIEEVWSGFTYFRDNDILFAKITPCMENGKGTIANNLTNGIGFGSTEFHVLRPKKGITSRFVFQILSLSDFRKIAEKKMTGSAGQKRVPKQFLENFNISVPPLSLQTQFAIRIEKIEGQKELIKQGVAETQQLIDYTMDKYFG